MKNNRLLQVLMALIVVLGVSYGQKAYAEEAVEDQNVENVEVIQPTTLTVSRDAIYIAKGQAYTVKATIDPIQADDPSITWKSSNTKVATVNEQGLVLGKSNGTVTITATANGNKQLVEKVKVNVSAKKVSTNKKTATLRIGQSTTVKASVSPSDATKKAITWTTSNSKVATVNSKGVIKAKKAGTVTITAKAASATSGKVKVTVKAPVQAKSVTLNKSSVTLGKGQSTTLVAKVYPSNTDNKTIKWSTSNSKVVKVDSKGRLTGVGVGTATVKAATTNGKYKKVTVKVVLKPVKKTLTTGTWTVGTHLAPGFYDVTTSSGSGNLIVTRGQYNLVVNEVLSAADADYGNVTRVTAEFKKGDKIRISNLNNATFTPAKRSLRTTLHAGRWIVGKDIRAGRYTATVSEDSGNFIITRGEYHLVVNEILSTDPNFGVKQVTFTVKNGDDIQITGLNAVRFKRH